MVLLLGVGGSGLTAGIDDTYSANVIQSLLLFGHDFNSSDVAWRNVDRTAERRPPAMICHLRVAETAADVGAIRRTDDDTRQRCLL